MDHGLVFVMLAYTALALVVLGGVICCAPKSLASSFCFAGAAIHFAAACIAVARPLLLSSDEKAISIKEARGVAEPDVFAMANLVARSYVRDKDGVCVAGVAVAPDPPVSIPWINHDPLAFAGKTHTVVWCLNAAPGEIRKKGVTLELLRTKRAKGLWMGIVDRESVKDLTRMKVYPEEPEEYYLNR